VPISPARVKGPCGGMIFILFLISVVTLEAILRQDRKRSDSAPPEDAADSTSDLRSLAEALGSSVSPSPKPEVREPEVESVRRTDLN